MNRFTIGTISAASLAMSLVALGCTPARAPRADAVDAASPPRDAAAGHDGALDAAPTPGDDASALGVDAATADAGEMLGTDAGEVARDAAVPPDHDAGASLERRFVAVGYGGHRTVSLDGRTWGHHLIEDPAGGDDPSLLRGVGYGDGTFIAVGNRIMTSTDGIEWTTRVADTGSFLSDVVWADGLWVAAGGNGLRLRSTDGGATFTDPAPYVAGHFRSIDTGNGAFVAVGATSGDAGLSSTTTDGVHWTDHIGGPALAQVAFGADMFVAVGSGGRVSISTDGMSWDERTLGSGGLQDVAFANGEWMVHGGSSYWTSTDASTWTMHSGSLPDAIVQRDGVYVGVTWSAPLLASSTPGGPWTTVDSTRPALTDVAVSTP